MSSPPFLLDQLIVDWLEQIPASTDASQSGRTSFEALPSRKRKRQSDHRLLSPPTSLPNPFAFPEEMSSSGAPKKRKKDETQDDSAHDEPDGEQVTPRPKSKKKTNDANSVSSASQSQHSNSSSAHMVFQQLSIDLVGPTLERRPMIIGHAELPRVLSKLIIEFRRIGAGFKVVPGDLQPMIEDSKALGEDNADLYALFDDHVYDPSLSLRRKGRILLDDVLESIEVAGDCDETGQDEAGWNNLVHTPLLDLAFDGRRGNLVGFAPCMQANISARSRISGFPGARVDYSMYLNPVNDPDPRVLNAVRQIQLQTPDNTVNHTPFVPLRGRPIGVTVETKRQDGATGKAALQIGIWQASHWKKLSELAGDAINQLPFLPGIVIEGHEWSFVASTHEKGRTILWASESFGNTLSPLDTFQAIAGVRRLQKWMVDMYWPWYKQYVLRIV